MVKLEVDDDGNLAAVELGWLIDKVDKAQPHGEPYLVEAVQFRLFGRGTSTIN